MAVFALSTVSPRASRICEGIRETMYKMKKTNSLMLFVILLLGSCSYQSLERASRNYKADKDYASLQTIYKHLGEGIKRTEVERLLGEPDYSPIEGQYYFATDRSEYPESGAADRVKLPVGLVVDYRNQLGGLTDELQTFWLGPIGE